MSSGTRFLRGVSGLLCVLVPGALTAEPWVRGKIQLVDESGEPWPPSPLIANLEMELSYRGEDGKETMCPGRGPVGTYTWTFEYPVHESCHTHNLTVGFSVRPALDWKIVKPPKEVHWDGAMREYDLGTIPILRPRSLAKGVREAFLSRAKDAFSENPREGLALFVEAGRGDDVQFTALAANYLEEQGHQAAVYDLLSQKDIASLSADVATRFRLTMRKAHGARAAGSTEAALEAYAEAQAIFPRSLEPVAFAYTVARQETGAAGPSQLAQKLKAKPSLLRMLKRLLSSWRSKNKPSSIEDDRGGIRIEALRAAGVQADEVAARGCG